MINNNKPIYVDEAGRLEIETALKQTLRNLIENSKSQKDAYYEEARDDEQWYSSILASKANDADVLKEQLKILKDMQSRLKVITRGNDESLVDINDTVRIIISSSEGNEEMIIKLVGTKTDYDKDIMEASINSPLGEAIYKKHINETVSYIVENSINQVTILEKINTNQEENTNIRTKK